MKTITITEEDLKRAQEEYDPNSGSVSCCCLIFQALRREGYEVKAVYYTSAILYNTTRLRLRRATPITEAGVHRWPEFVGHTFDVL
jgi:hypothetical protein